MNRELITHFCHENENRHTDLPSPAAVLAPLLAFGLQRNKPSHHNALSTPANCRLLFFLNRRTFFCEPKTGKIL